MMNLKWGGRRLRTPLVAVAAAAGVLTAAASDAAAAGPRQPGQLDGRYIVVYERDTASPARKTERLEGAHGFRSRLRYGRALKGFAAQLSAAQVRALQADPDVALVAPDRPVKALAGAPVAAGDSVPAGVRRIAAGTTSTAREASTANVAIVDTGIDLGHPDLNAVDGTNCLTSGAPADDDNGHGTHVAGTVGARNDGAGVLGVAPGTRTYAVKVLDAAGNGSYAAIICGIDWVTATRTDADPGNDVAVANLSLGGPGAPVGTCATTTDPLHRAMCASIATGVTYVVAAGNDGWDFDYAPAPDTPAAYPEALTVTAMSDSDGAAGAAGGAPSCTTGETDDRAATFSNFAATGAGAAHIIAAPGVCVRSTWPGGGTRTISGTSMATPHVAGAVALCIGEAGRAGPCAGMTPSQIVARMRSDAQANTSTTAGFTGDPTRSFAGASFGYLAWAAASEATAPATDATAPSAGAASPGSGATGVATTAAVSVTFSEPMDKGSAQAAFSLTPTAGGATVAGTFSWTQDTMTFRPSAALSEGTAYTAKVGPGARDVAGNGLSAPPTWEFRTLTTVTATPFATAIESGSLRSGTYSRLAADDNLFYEVTSSATATRTSSWYARFTGVAQDLRSLRVLYRGRNSATCAQTVSIWRWTTSSWAQLDSRSVGSTEVLVDRSASATLADFVSASGEARVRVRCTSTTQGFYSRGDQLRLVHTRP